MQACDLLSPPPLPACLALLGKRSGLGVKSMSATSSLPNASTGRQDKRLVDAKKMFGIRHFAGNVSTVQCGSGFSVVPVCASRNTCIVVATGTAPHPAFAVLFPSVRSDFTGAIARNRHYRGASAVGLFNVSVIAVAR